MLPFYFALVFVAGALIAMQAGVNSQLARLVGHPIMAATISFVVGTVALVACVLALRQPWPALAQFLTAPWWIWTGGLMGAMFVVTMAALAPTLGATTLLSVTLAGQMTFALIADHYGLLGFPIRPVSAGRTLGLVLLLSGVLLIRRC